MNGTSNLVPRSLVDEAAIRGLDTNTNFTDLI